MTRLAAVLLVSVVVLALAAARSPEPVARAHGGETAWAPSADASVSIPLHPRGTRSGVAVVDRVLDAVEAQDIDAFVDLVRYERVACVKRQRGIGGPPRCPPGVKGGTRIEVFPVGQCEGFYLYPDDLPRFVRNYLTPGLRLYAVYAGRPRFIEEGRYGIVLSDDPRGLLGELIVVGEDGVRYINYGCSGSPASFLRYWGARRLIVPPLPMPESALRRLLQDRDLPDVRGTAPCEVRRAPARWSKEAPAFGFGPFYLTGLDQAGVLRYRPGGHGTAGAGALTIVRAPRFPDALLLRGVWADAEGRVRFREGGESSLQAWFPATDFGKVSSRQLSVTVPAPGCYFIATDGLDIGGGVYFLAGPQDVALPARQTIPVVASAEASDGGACIDVLGDLVPFHLSTGVATKVVHCRLGVGERDHMRFTRRPDGVHLLLGARLALPNRNHFPRAVLDDDCWRDLPNVWSPGTDTSLTRSVQFCTYRPPAPGAAQDISDVWVEVLESAPDSPESALPSCLALARYTPPPGARLTGVKHVHCLLSAPQ